MKLTCHVHETKLIPRPKKNTAKKEPIERGPGRGRIHLETVTLTNIVYIWHEWVTRKIYQGATRVTKIDPVKPTDVFIRCSQRLLQRVSKMPNLLMEQHSCCSQWLSPIKQINGSLREVCSFCRYCALWEEDQTSCLLMPPSSEASWGDTHTHTHSGVFQPDSMLTNSSVIWGKPEKQIETCTRLAGSHGLGQSLPVDFIVTSG